LQKSQQSGPTRFERRQQDGEEKKPSQNQKEPALKKRGGFTNALRLKKGVKRRFILGKKRNHIYSVTGWQTQKFHGGRHKCHDYPLQNRGERNAERSPNQQKRGGVRGKLREGNPCLNNPVKCQTRKAEVASDPFGTMKEGEVWL